MLKIEKLRDDQLDAAARLLAATFVGDLGMIALFPRHRADDLRNAMELWYVETLRMWLKNDQPVLCAIKSDELIGILIVTDTSLQMGWLSQIWWALKVTVKNGIAPVQRAMEHDSKREKQFASMPSFIVEFVAVAQSARGQGVGKALFEVLHTSYAEKAGWLETTKEENLSIFAKLGYEHVRTNVSHGVDHHQMKREKIET